MLYELLIGLFFWIREIELVNHCSLERHENLGLLKIDSGKVNVFSHELIQELQNYFDELLGDDGVKAIILTGKEGIFSAGYDLKVMNAGVSEAMALVKAGGQLLTRLYLLEKPLIIASGGHCMAMGAITLFTGDIRIGAEGPYKIGLNESSIGMPLPKLAVALGKSRIPSTMQTRAMAIGEVFDPQGANVAGYYDLVVPADELIKTAFTYATQIGGGVDLKAFAENKRRLRTEVLSSVADVWD